MDVCGRPASKTPGFANNPLFKKKSLMRFRTKQLIKLQYYVIYLHRKTYDIVYAKYIKALVSLSCFGHFISAKLKNSIFHFNSIM